jgi:predicted HD phosphohydrolase
VTVRALLHDIGDTLATYNHPDIAAAMRAICRSPVL